MQNKWILCVKWFVKELKPMVITEEERKADKPPNKKPEFNYIPKWIPLGIAAGVPKWWDSQNEVTDVLKSLVHTKPEIKKNLFVACQVKCVPGKVKSYNEDWFKKNVKKEVKLKIEKQKTTAEAMFTDESRIDI